MDPPMMLPFLPSINQSIYQMDYPYLYPINHGQGQAQSNIPTQSVPQPPSQPMQSQIPNQSILQTIGNQNIQSQSIAQSQGVYSQPYQTMSQQATPLISYSPSQFMEKLHQILPLTPLRKLPNRPNIYQHLNAKRSKRKSKFTKLQDDLIVKLKNDGKNWVEIAEFTKVGSYLAARNRYQVIIGQQGNNNSSSWNQDYNNLLKSLLDKYENEKWKFITIELNKVTGKNFTVEDIKNLVKHLFNSNPFNFNVNDELINELIKEKKITEKAFETVKNNDYDDFLNYDFH